jgi:hypothetical protein
MIESVRQRRLPLPRLATALIAILLPLVPIAIAIRLGQENGVTGQTRTVELTSHLFPVDAVLLPKLQNLMLPPGSGALTAVVERSTPLRSRPGGPPEAAVSTRTQFGSQQVFWVARLSGPWLGVVSPQAGNNRIGWIPAVDASLDRVDWQIRVALAQRELTVLHAGRPVERFTVAVGRPSAPTPTGRFAVTDLLHTGDPTGPYGCCILALSAEAPHAIQGWYGGNRIAIHSTPEVSSIGHAVSHGCLRLTIAEGEWLIAHIPLGTPTLISSA